jgi:sugar phosphate isomerase/epimerase
MNLNRRDFVGMLSALPLLAAGNNKLDRIACNSWPFRGYFNTPGMTEYRDAKLPLLTQAEFPQFLADHFGIHNVEFLPQHFVTGDEAEVAKVNAGLKKAGSKCVNLMGVDIPGGVYSKASKPAIVKAANLWVGVAVALGAPTVTVALGGPGPADAKVAAENLKPFVEIAHGRGLKVLFHNDSIETETAEVLTGVIKILGADKTGTCPDFGNFATRSAAYALSQLKMLAPYATNICHAKDGIADSGKFHADDFPASMKVMKDAGFHGVYSLEFEGLGPALEGVKKLLGMTEAALS